MAIKVLNSSIVDEKIKNQDLSIFYRITGLRKKNLLYEYTQYEIEEILKCRENPIYFFEKYCLLPTYDGKKTICLRDYQEEIVNKFKTHKFNIAAVSRQVGISTLYKLLIVHSLIFSDAGLIGLLDPILCNSKEIMDSVKEIYTSIPFYMQAGVISWNAKKIKLDNGNTFSIDSKHRLYADYLFINDFSSFNSKSINKVLKNTIPVMVARKKSKLFISFTPTAFDQPYSIYMEALNGNNAFNPTIVNYWQVPGRDEKWKEGIIKIIGEEIFNREYALIIK